MDSRILKIFCVNVVSIVVFIFCILVAGVYIVAMQMYRNNCVRIICWENIVCLANEVIDLKSTIALQRRMECRFSFINFFFYLFSMAISSQ
jgi:uncharacterized membrane protein (Fun14 family)